MKGTFLSEDLRWVTPEKKREFFTAEALVGMAKRGKRNFKDDLPLVLRRTVKQHFDFP